MNELYIDKIDEKKTINEMKKHLKKFHMFCKSDIMDYVSIGNIGGDIGNGASCIFLNTTGILNAIEKNDERQEYIRWILNGIEKLEREEKELILYKHFYGFSDNDISSKMGFHERTIKNKIKNSCFSLALILNLEVLN